MNAEMVARTIQMILAPVVMVTACAITLGGLQGHYAAINDRLRAMARERLDLLRAAGSNVAAGLTADSFTAERLQEIDTQIPDLLHRHKVMRDSVLSIYTAMSIFVACMFVIAWAAAAESTLLANAALIVFLTGTGALLLGVLLAAVEIRTSHRAIEYEVRRVSSLGATNK